MPIDDDMRSKMREANELFKAYRSEISNLGSLASEYNAAAAALGYASGAATSVAVHTLDHEVNIALPSSNGWSVLRKFGEYLLAALSSLVHTALEF